MLVSIPNSSDSRKGKPAPGQVLASISIPPIQINRRVFSNPFLLPGESLEGLISEPPEGLRLRLPDETIQAGDVMRMKGRTWDPIPVQHSIGNLVSLHDHMDFYCRIDGMEVARG